MNENQLLSDEQSSFDTTADVSCLIFWYAAFSFCLYSFQDLKPFFIPAKLFNTILNDIVLHNRITG